MFEVKDYGKVIEINDIKFSIDVGNIVFIEKLMEIESQSITEMESLKTIDEISDVESKIKFVREKINLMNGWTNALLCDSKAVEKILGDKKNSVQNVADLFAHVLREVSQLQTNKLEEKSKDYAPVK